MYLKSIHIKNIRGIEDFKMEFPEGKEAGWHVLLGANGSGKTTVLRSIALARIGPMEILRLNPNLEQWIRQGSPDDSSEIEFEMAKSKLPFPLSGGDEEKKFWIIKDVAPKGWLRLSNTKKHIDFPSAQPSSPQDPSTYLWSYYITWFSCGFGPYRRFLGTDEPSDSDERAINRAHKTLFSERFALLEIYPWLRDLYSISVAGSAGRKEFAVKLLVQIKELINEQQLLNGGIFIKEFSFDGPIFQDIEGGDFSLAQLSDGMKSVLGIAFELFRQLSMHRGEQITPEVVYENTDFRNSKGIVLIDEPDAHLHPDWQARIGTWFRKVFPNIQFIVATHSPLVVRAAGDDSQIWWLPAAGSEEKARLIENGERNRLVYGNVLDAYGTEVFGEQAGRSPEARELMQRLAKLETMALFNKIDGNGLAEIEVLRTKLDL